MYMYKSCLLRCVMCLQTTHAARILQNVSRLNPWPLPTHRLCPPTHPPSNTAVSKIPSLFPSTFYHHQPFAICQNFPRKQPCSRLRSTGDRAHLSGCNKTTWPTPAGQKKVSKPPPTSHRQQSLTSITRFEAAWHFLLRMPVGTSNDVSWNVSVR